MFKTKITNLPLKVVHDHLLPLHPVLDLQVDLGLLGIVPNDIPHPKTWCSTSMSSLVYSEVKLLIVPRYVTSGQILPQRAQLPTKKRTWGRPGAQKTMADLKSSWKNLQETVEKSCDPARSQFTIFYLIEWGITGGTEKKTIAGWTEEVKVFQEEAQFYYSLWLSAGRPNNTDLHWAMKHSRNQFHYAVRRAKRNEETIPKHQDKPDTKWTMHLANNTPIHRLRSGKDPRTRVHEYTNSMNSVKRIASCKDTKHATRAWD